MGEIPQKFKFMELFTLVFLICLLSGIACFWLFYKVLTGSTKFKKESLFMYTTLFIVSLIMFCYLVYVLIKPEKF